MTNVQTDGFSPRLLLSHPLLSTLCTLMDADVVASAALHHNGRSSLLAASVDDVNRASRDGSPTAFSP